jgi:glutathionylspermidine synthase
MQRIVSAARPDWQARVEEQGFTYHSGGRCGSEDEGTHWDESVHYEFTSAEVDAIESATRELHTLCIVAAQRVADDDRLLTKFGISPQFWEMVRASCRRSDPHWMGRFDLAFDPSKRAPKLLEYNADTPTTVIETAVVQWFWLQDSHPEADQFNSLHEKLLARLQKLRALMDPDVPMHFAAWDESLEETQHTTYFMDLAGQAGIKAEFIAIKDIGWDADRKVFVDLENRPIVYLHKLYPWEWLVSEEFGPRIPLVAGSMGIIEPAWKMLLSNKGILPVLWEMFPGHPNLLPASWEPDGVGLPLIKKPILGREGANMMILRADGSGAMTGGTYGGGPSVYQALAKIPDFDGRHAVIGSWVVGDEPAGMIIRESTSPIVTGGSRVVPHLFR